MKLNLEINLPDDALVIDVKSLTAAIKFVLRGLFPTAKLKTTFAVNSCAKKATPDPKPTTFDPTLN